MGIALPETKPASRSKLASAAFTAIGLMFFFGVGLAGGAAYKIYFGDDGGPTAQANPPPVAPPQQNFTASAASPAESPVETAAATPVDVSPPVLASAPPPAEATEAPTVAQAASPPPAPSAAEAAPQTVSAEPQAAPDAAITPVQPDAQAAMPSAEGPPLAAAPPKPAAAAKAHRPTPMKAAAPQIAAMHSPTAAHDAAAGAFRVQFGAFGNEDNARRMQWAIEATGLKVEVTRDRGASGNPLFFVRSQSYPDRAAAMSAAAAAQNRARHFANPVAIDYAIVPDRAAGEQHAQR